MPITQEPLKLEKKIGADLEIGKRLKCFDACWTNFLERQILLYKLN
jgi:hypothetical protein